MVNNSLYNKILLCSRYYPRVLAYYFKEWNDFHMTAHIHDRVEIMYVISGTCTVGVNNTTFGMKKGEFVLIDANVSHNLVVEKNCPCRMLNIEFTFEEKPFITPSYGEISMSSVSFKKFLREEEPFVILRDPEEVYPALKSLIAELDGSGVDRELIIQLLMVQLLVKISRLSEERNIAPNAGAAYVRKAMTYMQQHYDRDIKVEDIAAAVNLHPSYLHRVFKANQGITLLEYLTNVRMEKSKMLLANTDIPIIDVSGYVGINSRQYFTYMFKRNTGITPQAFRKAVNKMVLSKEG